MKVDGKVSGKGEGIVNTAPHKFVKLMGNMDKRALFDDMFHSGKEI